MAQLPLVTCALVGIVLESVLIGFLCLLFTITTWISMKHSRSMQQMSQPTRKASHTSLLRSHFAHPLHAASLILFIIAVLVRSWIVTSGELLLSRRSISAS
jgi:hypothetical protein